MGQTSPDIESIKVNSFERSVLMPVPCDLIIAFTPRIGSEGGLFHGITGASIPKGLSHAEKVMVDRAILFVCAQCHRQTMLEQPLAHLLPYFGDDLLFAQEAATLREVLAAEALNAMGISIQIGPKSRQLMLGAANHG